MDTIIETKITLNHLTKNSVDVLWQDVITIDGVTRNLGLPHAGAYVNDEFGRSQIKLDLPENYQKAIFAVWGDKIE